MGHPAKLENRLKEIRLRRNLTQEALARAVGVTRQTIISIEKGRIIPSVRLALELALALEVDVRTLFVLGAAKGRKKQRR